MQQLLVLLGTQAQEPPHHICNSVAHHLTLLHYLPFVRLAMYQVLDKFQSGKSLTASV